MSARHPSARACAAAALCAVTSALSGCAAGGTDGSSLSRSSSPQPQAQPRDERSAESPSRNGAGGASAGEGRGPSAAPGRDHPAPEALVRADCPGRDLVPRLGSIHDAERATLCLVNAERRARGLQPLREEPLLTEAARAKSRDMVERGYFAHVGPDERDFRDWVSESGYLQGATGYRIGENLAWMSGSGPTPARIVLGWLRSEGHRRNLLSDAYDDSGIGIVVGSPTESSSTGAVYTHVLAHRSPAA